MKKYMTYGGRKFAAGGAMPMEQLTEFNEGGRHEENSLGGIPQGMNPEGQMNLVEEGETKFDAENYIFSDTLKVDKELADAFNLDPKMVGKTFADASKMAGRKKSKREGDAIEEAANNKDLENLMEAQEAFKQARIEEKLQEIAELDPDALPALMGQGQPQGDPAMGGQMQEAPMDEQAMMEEQMMAQQGGGGQPSPEEMAMMQQQQDMAMGQQEGMMRSGGKLPKEILKARVKSHMSPAQADAYVNSYAGGGYMTRSYALGSSMGMDMANAGMINTGAMGTSGDPVGCPCANGSVSTACCSKDYEEFDRGIYKEKFDESGGKIARTDRDAGFRGSNKKLPFRHRQALKNANVNYSQQVTGTDGGTDKSLLADSNMSQNYANIDMSQYTPEQQELMQGQLWAKDPKMWAKMNPGILNKKDLSQMNKVSKALDWSPPASNTDFIISNFDREKNPGLSDKGIEANFRREKAGKDPKTLDFDRDLFGYLRTRIDPRLEKMEYKPKVVRQSGPFQGSSRWILDEDRGRPKIKSYNEFGGDLMQSGQEAGLNPMQGMNQLMRRGGKMCYGCGGAMHNYGGRLMADYRKEDEEFNLGGKIVRGLGTAMQTIGSVLPVPGLNTAIKVAGAGLTNVDTGADGKEVLKDMSLAALPGVLGGLAGGLDLPASVKEKAVKGAKKVGTEIAGVVQDSTADSDKSQIQRNQILENGTPEQQAEVKKQMQQEEGIAKIGSTFGNLFKPQTQEEEENQDLIARYGKKLYRAGGLWANIHAKRARGEAPLKPGEEGYPSAKAIKASQNAMGGRMYYPGGQMQFMPNFAGPEINDKKVKEEIETDEFNDMYPDSYIHTSLVGFYDCFGSKFYEK